MANLRACLKLNLENPNSVFNFKITVDLVFDNGNYSELFLFENVLGLRKAK